MFPRSIFCISIALVTAGAIASGAQSTPPVSAPPMLHACVGKIGGFARIVPSRNDCILEFETFVSWNQNGVAGAQGPTGPNGIAGLAGPSGLTGPSGAAGPQGITGPVGPTGPRGAGLTQNFTAHSAFGSGFPSGIVSFLNYPITGFYTSSIQPLANVVQQIPIGCIATNFTVTATGAMGNSVASVSLLLAPSPAAASTSYHTTPVCQLVSNAGQTVSCTAAGPFTIPAGSAVTFNINLSNGTDFTNAQLITSFSCQ